MRPITVSVGPLAAASANNIATSQKAGSAKPLVLNGTTSSATANNICTSQSAAGAANLTINGALAVSGAAVIPWPGRSIYVTSAANDSGITFTINGLDKNFGAISETLTGANTSTVATAALFYSVTSIATSGATAGNVTVGTFGTATLDKARNVIITSGGNDSGITFRITGTDWAGDVISETLTGASGAAATSVLNYLSVTQVLPSAAVATTVTVGTNGVAASPWVYFDQYTPGPVTVQCTVSGTVNYSVQQSMDDPNSVTNAVAPASMTWLSDGDSNVVAATGSEMSSFAFVPRWARVLLNSGTGTVTATFTQAGGTRF